MKKLILTLFVLIFFLGAQTHAERLSPVTKSIDDVNHVFTAREFSFYTLTLPYREDKIMQRNDGEKSCLVIFLHGGSALGNDNTAQLETFGVDDIAAYLQSRGIKSVFLVPQCPKDRLWNETEPKSGFFMSEALKALIDEYVSSGDIDTDRIYILGASAGGAGVWRMVSDYSGLFAATMPCAVTPSNVIAESAAKTPLCVVAGDSDKIGRYNAIEEFVQKIRLRDGEVTYALLQGSDHEATCRDAWSVERLDWVFAHTRQNAARPRLLTFSVKENVLSFSFSHIKSSAKVFVALYTAEDSLASLESTFPDTSGQILSLDLSLDRAAYVKLFLWDAETLSPVIGSENSLTLSTKDDII